MCRPVWRRAKHECLSCLSGIAWRIAGDKPDPSDLPMIRLALLAIDDIDSQYRKALQPSIDVPAAELLPQEPITKHSGPYDNMEMFAKTWQEL